MANWANPTITTNYDVFVNEAKDRDVDAATLFLNNPTNPPVGAVQLYRPVPTFRTWNGSAWGDVVLSVVGGGTGSATAAGARAGLGIGTMGTQNMDAVTIQWGAANLYSLGLWGSIAVSADNTHDLGTNAARFRKGYFRDAFVIPAGVDKFATS